MDFDLNKAIQYFQEVVTKHYTDFQGRVARRDFWTYIVVYIALALIVAIVQGLVGFGLLALVQLALFLPTAGIIARRLQDIGKNGSLVWILDDPGSDQQRDLGPRPSWRSAVSRCSLFSCRCCGCSA